MSTKERERERNSRTLDKEKYQNLFQNIRMTYVHRRWSLLNSALIAQITRLLVRAHGNRQRLTVVTFIFGHFDVNFNSRRIDQPHFDQLDEFTSWNEFANRFWSVQIVSRREKCWTHSSPAGRPNKTWTGNALGITRIVKHEIRAFLVHNSVRDEERSQFDDVLVRNCWPNPDDQVLVHVVLRHVWHVWKGRKILQFERLMNNLCI